MGKKSSLEKADVVVETTPVVEVPVEPVEVPVVEPVAAPEPAVTLKVKKPRTVKQLAADEKLRQRAKELREFKKAKEAEKQSIVTHPHVQAPAPAPAPPPPPPPPPAQPAPSKPKAKKKATPPPEPEHVYLSSDSELDDIPTGPKVTSHYRMPRKYRIKS